MSPKLNSSHKSTSYILKKANKNTQEVYELGFSKNFCKLKINFKQIKRLIMSSSRARTLNVSKRHDIRRGGVLSSSPSGDNLLNCN